MQVTQYQLALQSSDGLTKKQCGAFFEDYACQFLTAHGLQLLTRNYQCRYGEIDLIMRDPDTLIFIEVRYRRSSQFGGATASVDRIKQHRLIAAAQHYRDQSFHTDELFCRFDVLAIEGHTLYWFADAFDVERANTKSY
jgi:putative endonuclease